MIIEHIARQKYENYRVFMAESRWNRTPLPTKTIPPPILLVKTFSHDHYNRSTAIRIFFLHCRKNDPATGSSRHQQPPYSYPVLTFG